jgi:hypothetical protein
MARKDKLAMLREIHEDAAFEEIEGSNHLRVNGQRAYVLDPTRELSTRHELVADLAATGLKPAEIGRLVKTNSSKSDGGYYATLLRDPRIRERTRSNVQDVVDVAKEKLKSVVLKATENITDAVEAGDVKLSQYVLGMQGLTDKVAPVQPAVTLDFGSWMGQLGGTKTMHDISGNTAERKVITDESALPDADGLTLDAN